MGKLREDRGETLLETLLSTLITVLALTMLAGGITAAGRANQAAREQSRAAAQEARDLSAALAEEGEAGTVNARWQKDGTSWQRAYAVTLYPSEEGGLRFYEPDES